jgi:hypothetical protein
MGVFALNTSVHCDGRTSTRRAYLAWMTRNNVLGLSFVACAACAGARVAPASDSAREVVEPARVAVGRCGWPASEVAPIESADSGWLAVLGCSLHRVGAGSASEQPAHLRLDLARGTWEELGWMPRGHVGLSSSDRLFAVGGTVELARDTLEVMAFDETRDEWIERPALPPEALPDPEATGLHGVAVLARGDALYAFGGRWTGHVLHDRGDATLDIRVGTTDGAWAFDDARGWRALPRMPRPIAFASAVWLADRIWLIGGGDERSISPSTHVVSFDPATEVWREEPSLARPSAGGAVVHEGRIYAFPSALFDQHGPQIFDPEIRAWRQTARRDVGATGSFAGGAVLVDGHIIVRMSDAQTERLFEYLPAPDRWVVLGSSASPE